MFYNFKYFLAPILMLIATTANVMASEMRYTPVNPSFGGSPWNASYLSQSATEQRQFSAPLRETNRSQDFSRSITNSLLSRVSGKIADAIYGENAQDSGRFVLGDTVVDFQKSGTDVIINIKDNATGETTTVQVPAGTF